MFRDGGTQGKARRFVTAHRQSKFQEINVPSAGTRFNRAKLSGQRIPRSIKLVVEMLPHSATKTREGVADSSGRKKKLKPEAGRLSTIDPPRQAPSQESLQATTVPSRRSCKRNRKAQIGNLRGRGKSPTMHGLTAIPILSGGAFLLLLALPGCGAGKTVPKGREREEVNVFAAASLREAMREAGDRFEEREKGVSLVFNFAGSNTLAQQILASPRADIFLSANEDWMDKVEAAGLLMEDSRLSLLSNSLVVICRRDAPWKMEKPDRLCALDFKFLSLANPEGVPAGRYAREWLEANACGEDTLWERVRDRLAQALDVRAAMGLVESNPSIIGIVYKTDALSSPKVRVLYQVPKGEGPKISYSIALTKSSRNKQYAAPFFAFLREPAALALFRKDGFIPLPGD